ncbi:MAG: hypothetical protein ACFCU3_11205 [Verrucomicrobiales bacterium]
MSKQPRKIRISTDPSGPLHASPFAGLDLTGIKVVEDAPESPQSKASAPEIRQEPKPQWKGSVVLRLERKGRGGKAVVVLDQLPRTWSQAQRMELSKLMKKKLGVGGTLRPETIEVQTEDSAAVRQFLEEQGIQARGV